jgi:phenylalanyl-tRNA synthetase alpha chain
VISKLEALKKEVNGLGAPGDEKSLSDLRLKYLGKKGDVTLLSRDLKSLANDEKPTAGKLIGEIRNTLEEMLATAAERIKEEKIRSEIESEFFDVTLPGIDIPFGTRHPIQAVMDEIVETFISLGFQIEEGPEAETDFYNFESLNFPPEHPARDMQDTFQVKDTELLLRTHTSPVQIRAMEKYRPPLSVIAPGKVFRRDADVTHSPMFHQLEGFTVDKNITFGDLKGTIDLFIHRLYGPETKTRFRPSYFPFTEPSAEVDVSCVMCKGKGCRVCKQTGWLEILGCGMIHPNVLKAVKIDPNEWTGIADIRLLFENDLRFLKQF